MGRKKEKERTPLVRENWVSNFNLIGEAVINPDYTYKINERSEKSAWIYNSMNLGINCGEKCGTVYAEMMGGYSDEKQNVIYAHGKKEDGTDDFKNQIQVAWEDRDNPDILDTIGDMCFITVGLEVTNKGKTYYNKFLSEYDAIEYIQEHLENGTTVNVKGNLKYSTYQGNTQVRKVITSIVLSKKEPEDYVARFTQTILIDKDSASLKNIDKDKGVMYVDARVLDYVKQINGVEIKGQFPFDKQFEYKFKDLTNGDKCKKAYNTLFKVKKGVTQITFEGELIESGAVVTLTYDDLPDDIKELVEADVLTEEEAIARCTTNGSKERRMVLIRPQIKNVGDEDNKTPVIQKFEEKYDEEDLFFDIPDEEEVEESDLDDDELSIDVDDESDDDTDEDDSDSDDMSWINEL